MYNASHSGWKSEQFLYSLAFIPYEYCSSVLYCCLSLKKELDIEEFGNHTDLQYLAAAKKQYHGLRTLLAIGGSTSPLASFRHLVSSQAHQDVLVQLAARWMQMRHFDGAYLYWPEMQAIDNSDVIGAFRHLATSFNKLRLKLGIILPVNNQAFAMEAALEALTKDLDGFYDQIFLSPTYSFETSNGSALSEKPRRRQRS
ncbi:chitotriosidase-1-like [Haemaphysalis longicornis]